MSSNKAPQAPPPLPPRSRSNSDAKDASRSSAAAAAASRQQSKSKSRSRSNSDGVRMMQQQQQQYWGYPMPPNGNGMPNGMPPSGLPPNMSPGGMSMPPPSWMMNPPPNPMPPNGLPPNMPPPNMPPNMNMLYPPPHRASSSPSSEGYGSFQGHSHHLSLRPPPMQQQQPPSPLSGFNELSSIMGNRSMRSNKPMQPNGRMGFGHRRSASESAAPRSYNVNFLPPNLNMSPNHNGMPSPSGMPPTFDLLPPKEGETTPFLNTQGHSIRTGPRKNRSHMRQQSVNLFMSSYRGVVQPRKFRDVIWAILFLLQLGIMCWIGIQYGPDALVGDSSELNPSHGENDDDVTLHETEEDDAPLVLAYWNIIKISYTTGAFAMVLSSLALFAMISMSRRLVYVALVLSIAVSFAWGTIGIGISPRSFVPITGIISLMLSVGYMFVVWERIPFASANLTTALTGVRNHLGLIGIAFECQFLALVVSIYYSFAFVGLHDAMEKGVVGVREEWRGWVDGLLLVSYFWTYQVLRHIVVVTVAGTIGSWWFKKPSALYPTFLQATVFNFGSICYGSLFVGFVQLLRQFTEGLRPNRDDSAMMCLYESCAFFQERIVGCVDNLADSFTPWAFTYVGLYRYGLKEAGHHANELFEKRGWSRIVTDDLVPTVLAMVSLVIGGLTGSFAVILQALDGHGLTNIGHPEIVSFVIGFLIGIVLSTVLFSIISSSVAAVIVCFAGSPVEFHHNYPELSHEMRHAWREVWPGSLDVGGAVGMAA